MFDNMNARGDLYSVLGVTPSANRDLIRRRYHDLVLQRHPDKNGGDALKSEKFLAVQEAFDVLDDMEKKYEYDLARSLSSFHAKAAMSPDEDASIWKGWSPNYSGQRYSTPPAAPNGSSYFDTRPSIPVRQPKAAPKTPEDNGFNRANIPTTPSAPQKDNSCVYISSDDEQETPSKQVSTEVNEPSSPKSPSRGQHWSYYDYFDDDYEEKEGSMLQTAREWAEKTTEKWRAACKAADEAKVNLQYANRDEKEEMKEVYDAKCRLRESRRRFKVEKAKALIMHKARAREVLKVRKQQDAEQQRLFKLQKKMHDEELKKQEKKRLDEVKKQEKAIKQQEKDRKAREKLKLHARVAKPRSAKKGRVFKEIDSDDSDWTGD